MRFSTLKNFLFAGILSVVSLGAAQAQTTEDKTQIIQAALDLPEIQQALTPKEGEKQLYILDNGKILRTLKLKKFGKPVIITSMSGIPAGAPYIEFGRAEFKSSFADLGYKISNNRFKVNAKFSKKGNKWTKVSADIQN